MRVLLVVLLLLVSTALAGLVHASPPDPTWIPGVYDDADADDAVTLIGSGTGQVPPRWSIAPPAAGLTTCPTGFRVAVPLQPWASAEPPRAPPAP
jgi:hypothetical protein